MQTAKEKRRQVPGEQPTVALAMKHGFIKKEL